MIVTVVLTDLILHHLFGMRNSYFLISVISCHLTGVEQQFQIHHIVNNNRKVINFITVPRPETIPRLNHTGFGTKTRAE